MVKTLLEVLVTFEKVMRQLENKLSIDAVTTGNHWADQKTELPYLMKTKKILLPANMYNIDDIEQGLYLGTNAEGQRYAVINLIGRIL